MTGVILAIDDDESTVTPNVPDGFRLEVIDPEENDMGGKLVGQIDAASLILMDQRFYSDPTPLSIKAQDGASFVAHLRSWSRRESKPLPPIILYTNDPDAFQNEIPTVGPALPLQGSFVAREFQIAPALDVEWVQFKDEENAKRRIAQLASAFVVANDILDADGASLAEIEDLLKLPKDKTWSERAREEVRAARPPVSQEVDVFSKKCGPTQVIRWLCHKALPFPGLFLSNLYSAWALGVSIETFSSLIEIPAKTPWLEELAASRFCGPLDDFVGQRWFRSGIDSVAWKLDQECSKVKDRAQALKELAPGLEQVEMRSTSSHVVTWTPILTEKTISQIGDSVQISPPGWPAESSEPWMLRSDLKNDAVLHAMIDAADLS